MKIISGGQTGVDRAALDAALELSIPCGGWCPKGRKAEDGRIPERYPLKETDSDDYAVRTEWNVRDSDGTLIITRGKPTGGTAYTIAMARVHKKPFLVIDLCHPERSEGSLLLNWIQEILRSKGPRNDMVLNIAGPRESGMKGIYNDAKNFLATFFEMCR